MGSIITLQCPALFQIRSATRRTTHGYDMHRQKKHPTRRPQASVFHHRQHLCCWETLALSPCTLNIPLPSPSNTLWATSGLFTFPDFLISHIQILNGTSTELWGTSLLDHTAELSKNEEDYMSVCLCPYVTGCPEMTRASRQLMITWIYNPHFASL